MSVDVCGGRVGRRVSSCYCVVYVWWCYMLCRSGARGGGLCVGETCSTNACRRHAGLERWADGLCDGGCACGVTGVCCLCQVVLSLGDFMNVQCHACIGGKSIGEDIRRLDYGVQVTTN
jgi:hypothetical protein